MKPFWEITVQEWDTLMAVNLRGPRAGDHKALTGQRRRRAERGQYR